METIALILYEILISFVVQIYGIQICTGIYGREVIELQTE